MRKLSYLIGGFHLVLAAALASAVIAACSGGSVMPRQPAAAPAGQAGVPAASAPAVAGTPAPVPMSTEIPVVPAVLPVGTGPAGACPPGGALEDAAAVSFCAGQAMEQVESFSFDGEFNLLALLPGGDPGAAGLMGLSGSVVLPDRTRFEISFSPEGEVVRMAGVMVGGDTYVRDPGSGMWFRGDPPRADLLGVVSVAGLLQLPGDSGAALNDSITLDDGTVGYVLSYDQAGRQSGMEALGLPGGRLVAVVGADDFLTREVRMSLGDVDGGAPNLLTVRYHGYNEAGEVEPPERYATVPEESVGPGAPGLPTVLGLSRNEDGDVEVTFSRPVHAVGEVELYVLDPATGGWGLPLLGGSGTAVFTFDSDAEDRQPLVLGESRIDGFIFPAPGSYMTDGGGARLDLTLDTWTYR